MQLKFTFLNIFGSKTNELKMTEKENLNTNIKSSEKLFQEWDNAEDEIYDDL